MTESSFLGFRDRKQGLHLHRPNELQLPLRCYAVLGFVTYNLQVQGTPLACTEVIPDHPPVYTYTSRVPHQWNQYRRRVASASAVTQCPGLYMYMTISHQTSFSRVSGSCLLLSQKKKSTSPSSFRHSLDDAAKYQEYLAIPGKVVFNLSTSTGETIFPERCWASGRRVDFHQNEPSYPPSIELIKNG